MKYKVGDRVMMRKDINYSLWGKRFVRQVVETNEVGVVLVTELSEILDGWLSVDWPTYGQCFLKPDSMVILRPCAMRHC